MTSPSTAERVYAVQSTARKRCIPLTALVELTHRCNLHCRLCYLVADRQPELSTVEVLDLIDQLAAAGTLYLNFSGGEVLLREDLWEIVEHARSRNFAVGLLTNGTLIDEAAADRIASLDVLFVGVSIYAHRAEMHDAVTGKPGSFDASTRALRLLADRGVPTYLKCVVLATNVRHMDDITRLAGDLGAIAQFDPQLGPRNDGNRAPLELEAREDEIGRVMAGDAFSQTAEQFASEPPCSAGRDMVSIGPSGTVYPCVQMPLPAGSVREQPFAEIWSAGRQLKALREFRMADVARCMECADMAFCRPCVGLNVVENGELDKPASTTCRLTRVRKRGVGR